MGTRNDREASVQDAFRESFSEIRMSYQTKGGQIIVDHKGVKRLIEGPFQICGDRATLRRIAEQIENQLGPDFSYGWIEIWPEALRSDPNQVPLDWRLGGSIKDTVDGS